MSNVFTFFCIISGFLKIIIHSFLSSEMIDVCCAIIVDEEGKVLVAQRSAKMLLPLKMEFPGGKIEAGESAEECLIREIKEELDICIEVLSERATYEHTYPEFSIRLIPFVCRITSGTIQLKEHAAYFWVDHQNLMACDWAAADIPIAQDYLNSL